MTIIGSFTVVGIRLASTDWIQLLGCIVLCDCADEESVCHGSCVYNELGICEYVHGHVFDFIAIQGGLA